MSDHSADPIQLNEETDTTTAPDHAEGATTVEHTGADEGHGADSIHNTDEAHPCEKCKDEGHPCAEHAVDHDCGCPEGQPCDCKDHPCDCDHEQPCEHHKDMHGDSSSEDHAAMMLGHGEEGGHGDSHAEAGHGDAHAEGEHGGEHHEGGGIPELENAFDYYLMKSMGKTKSDLHTIHNTAVYGKQGDIMSLNWLDVINITYAFVAILFLLICALRVKSKLSKIPKKGQVLAELLVGGLDNYVKAIIGHDGRKFTPFIGTIFIYILTMNYMGLIPFFKAPVALNINVPISMAICVFLLVQYRGIQQNGPLGYLKHFTGDSSGMLPLDLILMPLNLVLHIIGELAKPITLSLRLFGNITGEDVVVAAFVGLTVGVTFFPIPVQALFYPLALLFGLIQALVFATLSAVYILLMSSHGEHH